jgi:hypothetical protein
VRALESHISKARCPEFPVRSSGQESVCAFHQGKAHEVQGTHETSQEIGDVGHPCSWWGERFEVRAVLEALGFENAAARTAYPSIPQVGVASVWGETAEPA